MDKGPGLKIDEKVFIPPCQDRRLLQSMGWDPDEHEGGLEDWGALRGGEQGQCWFLGTKKDFFGLVE